ncbi:hypothetical protein J3F84DRAFT_389333 [Trichoderma pleuroticola]
MPYAKYPSRQSQRARSRAVTAKGFKSPKRGECDICGRETKRRCQVCNRDWFCSQACQDRMSLHHLTLCPARSITTADKLWLDAVRDEIPRDPETREHFGLTRCRNWREESQLLGVYQGLVRVLGIQAIQLNEWREKEMLVSKIIETFSELPEDHRGAYFSWFLQNQHVLDNSTPPLQPANWQVGAVFSCLFCFFALCIAVFRGGVNANLIWGLLGFCLFFYFMFLL